MKKNIKKIILASHYGFCMGVKRAIKIAEETGNSKSGPVNVLNEIVHNDAVVEKLSQEGVGLVSSIQKALKGTIIISAHGQPRSTFEEAEKLGLKVVDATCPLVIRIHDIIQDLIKKDYDIIHFGDLKHDETKGVVGYAPEGRVRVMGEVEDLRNIDLSRTKVALTSQTTARVEDFEQIGAEVKKIIPQIEVFNTICNATTQRQAAVVALAGKVDVILVVGSSSSANSKRLRSISEEICGRAYLINSARSLEPEWLDGVTDVGLTAGASTPEYLVDEVISYLQDLSGGKAQVIRTPKKRKRRRPDERKRISEDRI
ncbi:MAG: 4-hydroxy-3-methylbut-2-enyl diphosphate reductase [candidate division Zixibacteria bacterium]